ncbi:MAG TPA: hypothetical protein VFG03_06465, partial [Telluria sp.]|nr:hypothetical protein [Telluria sp.]
FAAQGGAALNGAGWEAVAGRAILSNVATQGVGIATGLQHSFDWRGVASAGAGAAVGSAVGKALEGGDLLTQAFGDGAARNIAAASISGFTAGTTTAVLRGGRVSVQQIATDAFGNALGQSLAMSMQPGSKASVDASGASAGPMSKAQAERAQYGGMSQHEVLQGENDWLGSLGPYTGEMGSPNGDDSAFRALDASIRDSVIPKVPVPENLLSAEQKVESLFGLTPRNWPTPQQQPESAYTPMRSVLGDAYRASMREAFDSNNSWGTRTGYGASALIVAIPGLFNDAARDILNAPGNIYGGSKRMAAGWSANDPYAFSNGLMQTSLGILGAAGAGSVVKNGLLVNQGMGAFSSSKAYARTTYEASNTLTIRVPVSTMLPDGTILNATATPARILVGDPNNVAIIGRSMDAVNGYAAALRAQGIDPYLFSSSLDAGMTVPTIARQEFSALSRVYNGTIPDSALLNTKMFQTNEAWAQLLKNQNYTVIDLGNPFNNSKSSLFFNVEQKIIFGETK